MMTTNILSSYPSYENDKGRTWRISHYKIKQPRNRNGDLSGNFFLYDMNSTYNDTVAFAVFHSRYYLDKYLELLMIKESIQ